MIENPIVFNSTKWDAFKLKFMAYRYKYLHSIREIEYGQGKLKGFLIRRLRLLIKGKCKCGAILEWNGKCPYKEGNLMD